MKIKIIDSHVRDNWSKTFSSKKAAKAWIMEGLMCTDGAEQSHYVSMLLQLEAGETLIDYWKEV